MIGFIFTVLAWGAMGALAYYWGYQEAKDAYQEQAVKRGYAKFVITDPATGKTQFKWNDEIEEGK